ncbi:DUF6683 family protein [Sphingomonas sp. DT-207]|uniref:DUF6683 family protein n=1 Tax=Sphingomonas sp. DT-207 TaxID=3396167 RepID=UPI003F1C4224
MKRSLVWTLGLALTWPAAASAQDMSWSTITPSITGTDVLGLHLREQVERQSSGSAEGNTASSRPSFVPESAAPAVNTRALRYTPSKSRRTANLSRFVDKTRATDPAGAAQLEKLFASGDIIDKIGGALAQQGMRVDNVADAYTVWWINAWQATRGHNNVTSRATNDAVRDQAARALSASPQLVGAGDAAKQELAESLLIQAAMIDSVVEQSKGNSAQMRQIGAAVNQGAKRMGLDLTTMELTEQGFVPASTGSRTRPSMPAEPVEAVAATATSASPGIYAPIALAALGAGVGGLILWNRGRG